MNFVRTRVFHPATAVAGWGPYDTDGTIFVADQLPGREAAGTK